jgi:hypothetical protein
MNKIPKQKVHVLLALFLSAVFFSTFLVKPVHILFVHHNLTVRLPVQSDKAILTIPSDADCPICDFEFCFFLSTDQPVIQKTLDSFAELQIPHTIDCFVHQTSHHFLLRAPPVV